MKNDPIYLFQESTRKASLGVLSVAGNLCGTILSEKCNYVKAQAEELCKWESNDRFLILDDAVIYHMGASLKDLGKKWFAFSKIDAESFGILGRLE